MSDHTTKNHNIYIYVKATDINFLIEAKMKRSPQATAGQARLPMITGVDGGLGVLDPPGNHGDLRVYP